MAAKVRAANKTRMKLLGGRSNTRSLPPKLRFYNTSDDVSPGKEQIARAADGELRAFQRFHRVSDRVAPRIHGRIQVVVHVKDREFQISRLAEGVLREI